MNFSPLILTFQLAFVTTLILSVLGIPLAYWLAFTKWKIKFFIQTLVAMPLVLPPSVLGFYLLVAFNPNGWLGQWIEHLFSLRLVFSFAGIVVGSVIFSLPFMVNPIQSALESLPKSLTEAAYTLGKTPLQTLWYVLLPNIRSALWTAMIMTFAHTIGEFGVVLMIGGNIPDQTRVASIAIYNEVEAMNYEMANFYALILLIISFVILLVMNLLNKK